MMVKKIVGTLGSLLLVAAGLLTAVALGGHDHKCKYDCGKVVTITVTTPGETQTVTTTVPGPTRTVPGPTKTVTQTVTQTLPAVTVPGPTVTVPGPTITVPGPVRTKIKIKRIKVKSKPKVVYRIRTHVKIIRVPLPPCRVGETLVLGKCKSILTG